MTVWTADDARRIIDSGGTDVPVNSEKCLEPDNPHQCGTLPRYWRGCHGRACSAANAEYARDRRDRVQRDRADTAVGRTIEPDDNIEWSLRAACRGQNDLMFPHDTAGVFRAQAICAVCPVRDECLDYALRHRQMWGVWGGRSERERVRILRRRAA